MNRLSIVALVYSVFAAGRGGSGDMSTVTDESAAESPDEPTDQACPNGDSDDERATGAAVETTTGQQAQALSLPP